MKKELLKNAFVMTALLLAVNILLSVIILTAFELLKIDSIGVSGVAVIVGAMLVGQIYASSFRQVMPSRLKIKVVLLSLAAQLAFGILYLAVMVPASDYLIFAVLLVIASIIYALATYWMLGVGGKIYINSALKKKKT